MRKKRVEKPKAVLFPPISKRPLTDEYPELAKEKEFQGLRTDELKFAWYYGVFYGAKRDSKEKISLCVKHSFVRADGTVTRSPREIDEYKSGNFPQHVAAAITKFSTYNIDARYRARFIAERALQNLEQFVEYDEDSVDWDQRKKYTDTITSIIKEIPNIIAMAESGHGVKDVNLSKFEFTSPMIDRWHQSKKE
jgi:hypothetical protein